MNSQQSIINESLTFDDISKYFSMPIAEAATILGVCTSVLKKICRDNGVIRWPYRKYLAGKSVDAIKKDAAREKNKELAEMSRAAKKLEISIVAGSSPLGSTQDTSKLQQTNAMVAHALQQDTGRFTQQGQHSSFYSSGIRNIPSYLDEFKDGFPTNGLSSISMKWWGNNDPDVHEQTEEVVSTVKKENQELNEVVTINTPNAPGTELKENEKDNTGGSFRLSMVRKRAAEDGRKALNFGIKNGFPINKISRRERQVLSRVFGATFPSQ